MVFERFTLADINGEVVEDDIRDSDHYLPNGYHPWLIDFQESSVDKELPDNITEGQLLFVFMRQINILVRKSV